MCRKSGGSIDTSAKFAERERGAVARVRGTSRNTGDEKDPNSFYTHVARRYGASPRVEEGCCRGKAGTHR